MSAPRVCRVCGGGVNPPERVHWWCKDQETRPYNLEPLEPPAAEEDALPRSGASVAEIHAWLCHPNGEECPDGCTVGADPARLARLRAKWDLEDRAG